MGSASSSSLVPSPADPSVGAVWLLESPGRIPWCLWMLSSHSLPWQLHWLPDPSWAIPALHSWGRLGAGDKEQPGTHRDIRAIPSGLRLGSGISQTHSWVFPAPNCWIRGLGASSCPGVSRPCSRTGWMGQELLQSRALTSPGVFSWTPPM